VDVATSNCPRSSPSVRMPLFLKCLDKYDTNEVIKEGTYIRDLVIFYPISHEHGRYFDLLAMFSSPLFPLNRLCLFVLVQKGDCSEAYDHSKLEGSQMPHSHACLASAHVRRSFCS
jgi:hypothetical protein